VKNQNKIQSSRSLSTRRSSALAFSVATLAFAACTSEPQSESPELGHVAQRVVQAGVPETATLAAAAKYADRLMGAAVQEGPLQNEAVYASTLAAQFNAVVPENAMKWGVLQPTNQDTWNFAAADAIVNAARANGQKIKGHTLVWHQQLPSWVNDSMTTKQLRKAAANHIKTTVKRYKGKVAAWDVVNEAVADDGSGLRDTIFLRKLGSGYVAEAFNKAYEYDSKAKLYYNDYGIETINAKSDAVYSLVQGLIEAGVPIDGIGMQAHISAQSAPSVDALKANFQRFVDLGLTVHLSELDVRVSDVPGDRNRRLAVQKQVYQRVVQACAEVEGCIAVATWGFTDKYSWIDSFYGPDDPLEFDDSYGKKPAFYGIIDGFVGVPADAAEAAPNYVANSSFESGTDGWTSWGGALAASTLQAHTGLRSVRVSDRTGSYLGPVIDVKNVVRPGGFDVSGYARVAGSASEPAQITAQVICSGEEPSYVPVAQATASDTDWVNLAGEIDVPDCSLDALNLYVEGPAAGVELFVDDFTVREQDSGLEPELLQNTTFETSLDGWFPWGAAQPVHSTEAAHSGLGSAYVTGRSNNFDGLATNLLASVTPGMTYQASGWILLDGAATGEGVLTAALRCEGDASTRFMRIGQAAASDSAWTLITGSIAVPDCTLTEFAFYVEGPAPGVSFYFDDPSFRGVVSTEGPNVIRNSTFDSSAGGTAWWFNWGPATVAPSPVAHTGDQSGSASARTATWQGIAYDILNNTSEPLVAGGDYELNAWVRINGAATGTVNFTTQYACAEGGGDQYRGVGNPVAATDTGWVQITGGLTVPTSGPSSPTCTLTKYYLYAEGAAAGVDILIDDVTLAQQL